MNNLIYFSIFLDKGILDLFYLLLMSAKIYSSLDTFDILIITSADLANEALRIADMFNVSVKTHIMECNALEEVVMSRLDIFDVAGIEQYSKILYLDADILIQGDLSVIFDLDLEDKLYAVYENDLTIESEFHGLDFFDFSKVSKSTPAINAGVLLFKNCENMKALFKVIKGRYEETRREGRKYIAIDQQLLNFYSIEMNLRGDETLISKYVKLARGLRSTIPVSPLSDKDVIINHFYGGSAMPKIRRMNYHLDHLLDIYPPPHIVRKDTTDLIEFKQYMWNDGRILFENKNKLITSWKNGSYKCLHDRVYKASWSNIDHILLFSSDFSSYTSIRLNNLCLGNGKEDLSIPNTLPQSLENIEEPILLDNKLLVYFCVFHNMDYFKLLELLLLSIKAFSPVLNNVEFLVLTNAASSGIVGELINKLEISLHVKILNLKTQHEAGCARLHIFDYEYINNYSKILYLDTDILVQGDLMQVFDCLKEDKVYAVKEYDIYGPGHGAFFFDFSKFDRKMPSLNSGILLFRNSAKVRSVFATINGHLTRMKQSGSIIPGCMDQPFIAYNLIQNDLAELESITKISFLAEHVFPPIDGKILLAHFVWPIGNASHKIQRMMVHFKNLLKQSNIPWINPNTLSYSSEKYIPSFNVLIATTGRKSLQTMLDSLSGQLEERDCITVVYDGLDTFPEFDFKNFVCEVQEFCEPTALGYWGHGIRNKYADKLPRRDFIMHADDDDIYMEGSFDELRKQCNFLNTLYIARTKNSDPDSIKLSYDIMPRVDKISVGKIATPSGVIPYSLNKEGIWELCYGGDGMFYKQIEKKANYIKFLQFFIYNINPVY